MPEPASAAKVQKLSALEAQEAGDPKFRIPWPFSKSPGNETSKTSAKDHELSENWLSDTEISGPEIPPQLPGGSIKHSAEWQTMSVAERIDAQAAERRAQEQEKILRSKERKKTLDLRLDITPDDSDWKKWHEKFREGLRAGSFLDVADKYLEEGQKLAILPPQVHGIILDIQKEHTKDYKKLLEGRFKSQKNNILTKLTMLHFGLPVEPLTLNNILNASNDEDDPEDPPEGRAMVQRIVYAEKPLEFLDLYHERSHGFPMLRRPKSQIFVNEEVAIPPTKISPSKITTYPDLDGPPPPMPMFPTGTSVGMRGGAGAPENLPVIVYGLDGVGVQIHDEREKSEDAFLNAALQILNLPKTTTTFRFTVDQYRNQEQQKYVSEKLWMKSWQIDQDNFSHTYVSYLKMRLYNIHGDYVIVVRATSTEKSPTFKIPQRLKKPAPPPVATLPQDSPKSVVDLGSKSAHPEVGLAIPQAPTLFPSKTTSLRKTTSSPKKKPAKTQQQHPPPKLRGRLEGFGGKLSAECSAEDFQRAALQLLQLDPRTVWSFNVLIKVPDSTITLEVNNRDFQERFHAEILPSLRAQTDWAVFVSRSSWHGSLELGPRQINLVRIRKGDDTAYWKVPDDRKIDYGINQFQDDFFRTMSILFPPTDPRPQYNIQIDIGHEEKPINLGFGGKEVTEELWKSVKKYLGNLGTPFDCSIREPEKNKKNSRLIGIRMVGSHHYETARPGNYADIYNAIVKLSKENANPGQPPKFRIWKTANAREDGGTSRVIEYKPPEVSSLLVKNFLVEEPGSTNCVWFRPEWTTITIKDITTKKNPSSKIFWNIVDGQGSLADFKTTLQELFLETDPTSVKDVEITDTNANRRFIISEDTTEEHWRKHIYDWISSDRINVKRIQKVTYKLEQMPPWGLPEPSEAILKAWKEPDRTNSKSDRGDQRDTPSPAPSHTENINVGAPPPPRSFPLIQPNWPRIPKERLQKARVATATPMKWHEWQLENTRLDQRQQESYKSDISVIEPGQKPEDPQFGHYKENALSVGSNLPTAYYHPITPSDVEALRKENQFLRNACLERTDKCVLCAATFPGYKPELIAEHYKAHQDKERSASICPLCSEDWSALDMEQRKQHLWHDQDKMEGFVMRNFWEGFRCPICGVNLKSLSQDAIINHLLEHPPGLLEYCDRCGVHLSELSSTETEHHDNVCVEWNEENEEHPSYCGRCGQEKSHDNGDYGVSHHSCHETFNCCENCGLNTAKLGNAHDIREHHQRCMRPGGPSRAFCKRCGYHLLSMTEEEVYAHEIDCFSNLPTDNDLNKQRLEEIQKRIAEEENIRERNREETEVLRAREEELACYGGAAGPKTLDCPLLLPDGNTCNRKINVTTCGTDIKAHYQHNCSPRRSISFKEAVGVGDLGTLQRFMDEQATKDNARLKEAETTEGTSSTIGRESHPAQRRGKKIPLKKPLPAQTQRQSPAKRPASSTSTFASSSKRTRHSTSTDHPSSVYGERSDGDEGPEATVKESQPAAPSSSSRRKAWKGKAPADSTYRDRRASDSDDELDPPVQEIPPGIVVSSSSKRKGWKGKAPADSTYRDRGTNISVEELEIPVGESQPIVAPRSSSKKKTWKVKPPPDSTYRFRGASTSDEDLEDPIKETEAATAPASSSKRKTGRSKNPADLSYRHNADSISDPESPLKPSKPQTKKAALQTPAAAQASTTRRSTRRSTPIADPTYRDLPVSDDEEPEATGFAPRGRKRMTPSPRKPTGKVAAGSKRKMGEKGDGEHPGFMFPKRQRMMTEEIAGFSSTLGGEESAETGLSAMPTSVRRSTRATSGTPSVGMSAIRKVGQPRTKQACENGLDEEVVHVVERRSLAKRGSPAKKGTK